MSTWTWERWEKEIDWMALHGINMPLQIVGLDVVWKRLLTEYYNYTSEEANAFIAGPCFQAWWGMNNLEQWGGPNPEWWYERQEILAKKICDRMNCSNHLRADHLPVMFIEESKAPDIPALVEDLKQATARYLEWTGKPIK